MAWQDKVFALGGVVLAAMLAPTLLDPAAVVPLATSVPTGLVLLVFGATFYTLDMRLSTATQVATGAMWLGIALLRHP